MKSKKLPHTPAIGKYLPFGVSDLRPTALAACHGDKLLVDNSKPVFIHRTPAMDDNQTDDKDTTDAILKEINRYYQEVTITDVSGRCPYGHQKGDTFKVTSMNHDCLCGALYQSIHPGIVTLEYGGRLPWEKSSDTFTARCPETGTVAITARRRMNPDPSLCLKTRTHIKNMAGKGFPLLDNCTLTLEIVDIANHCAWGHSAGETFEVDPFNAGKACGYLYWQAYEFIMLLLSGESPPWAGARNSVVGICPDPFNQVTYRLTAQKK